MDSETPGDAHLKLARFQLVDTYGRPLTMAEDGQITGPKGPWGRALRDGSVSFPDGNLRGRLLVDGRVVDAKGAQLATIAADGTAKVEDRELRFDQEGKLVGGDPNQSIRLTPPDLKEKRTAMLIVVLTQLRP